MKTNALILTGFGINCDGETAKAFVRAGAGADRMHLNDIAEAPSCLDRYQMLAVPGGFSFGDDIASGRILANRLRHKLGGPLKKFVQDGKLIIGICNGFQVLVKMGILPLFEGEFKQEVTLAWNNSCRFENRWVNLKVDAQTQCVWLKGMDTLEVPVRHGEGKFMTRDTATMDRLRAQGQIALRYADAAGVLANGVFPANPNGAEDDIAGICDPSGRIFGLMPHPEAHVDATNHPQWTRKGLSGEGAGLQVFRNAVEYAETHLV